MKIHVSAAASGIRKQAATEAAERFETLCEDWCSRPVGKLSALDVARAALQAKDEAETAHGIAIRATVDEEGNWSFE